MPLRNFMCFILFLITIVTGVSIDKIKLFIFFKTKNGGNWCK